jgi:hypothetical protein
MEGKQGNRRARELEAQKRNCQSCYFSRIIEKSLCCVKNPPALEDDTGAARWPIVKKTDICGYFRYADENPIEADGWPRNELPIYADRFGDYCKIPLTQGRSAKVDPGDYIWLAQFKWYCHKREYGCYAMRNGGGGTSGKKVLMHRQIMDTPAGLVCDHINRNGLDNRKANLRNCTKQENNLNQRSHRGSVSKYKGVYWKKDMRRWAASVQIDGRREHLGYFASEAEAAKAYDAAARKYHGEFAALNFAKGGEVRDPSLAAR